MQYKKEMTVAEVGDRLGVTRASVHDLLDSGQSTAGGRAGRILLIDRSSVERLARPAPVVAAPGRPGLPGLHWRYSLIRTPPGSAPRRSPG